MRCTFIGPIYNHAVVGRVAALVAAGYKVDLINAGHRAWARPDYPISQARILDKRIGDTVCRSEKGGSRRQYITRYLRCLGLMPEDRELASYLRSLVRESRPDFAVTHYGPIAIHYARILRRVVRYLPVIDILNLLPSGLRIFESQKHLTSMRLERANYRHWLKRLEGVVCASQEMLDYAVKEYGVSLRRSCVLPDYLPASFRGRRDSVDLTTSRHHDNPRVIFLGAPKRYGGQIDALDEQFIELANARIHVHAATVSEQALSTGWCHRYPLFTDEDVFSGRLAEYAAQFDAAIMTYNINRRTERFRSTYPTRFFTALTAGIPVAVHAGFFDACERLVTDEGIGFVYTTPSDLRDKLVDQSLLARCRSNAAEKTPTMTAEAQGAALRAFITRVLDHDVTREYN